MNSGLLSQLAALDSALASKFSAIEAYVHANKQSGQLNADYTSALDAGLQACINWYEDAKMPYLANAYIQTLSGYLQVRETFPDAVPALVEADHTPYALLDQGNFIGTVKNAALSYWVDGLGITGGTKLGQHFENLGLQTSLAQGYLNRYINRMNSKTSALLTWQTFEDLETNSDYSNEVVRTAIFSTLGWDAFLKARNLHALGIYSYPRDEDFESAILEPLPVVDPDDPEYDPSNFLQYVTPGDVPFYVRDGHFKLLFQPAENGTLTWAAGSVTFMSDTNQYVSATINAGTTAYAGNRIFIAYIPGNPNLVVTTTPAAAYLSGQSIVAVYDGGLDLRVFNTTRIIIGTEIAVNSMPPNRISAGDLLSKVRIGNTGNFYIDGGAKQIIIGDPETPTAVIGAHTETGFTTTAGYRLRKENGDLLMDSVNGLGPNTVGSLNIRPNSIQEFHLYFGARSIQEEGIVVTLDVPNDRVQWSSGSIIWYDNLGNTISTAIISGQAFYEGDRIFIVWEKGSDRFTVTTSTAIAYDADNYYIFAEYNGEDQLFRNFQSTLIDGSRIRTGTMDLNRLDADSVLLQTLFVGSERFVLDGANKYLRIKDNDDITRLLLGEITEDVFGIQLMDSNGDLYIDTTGDIPFFVRDDEITSSLKFLGAFAEAPVTTHYINSTYYNTVNGNTYVLQYVSGTAGPKQWNVYSLAGADGDDGSDGADARAVYLTSTTQAFTYNTTGAIPNPASATLLATAVNTTGTLYYEFFKNDVSVQNTTDDFYEYTPQAAYADMPDKIEVQVREGSDTGPIKARDQFTVIGLKAGANALNVIISNEAHTLPRTFAGVATYTGAGTDINVWEGTTQLPYDAALSASPSWRVSAIDDIDITVGSASTEATNTRRFADPSDMTSSPAFIQFTVQVKNSEGLTSTFTKIQSLAFSQQGQTGTDGDDGLDGDDGFRGSVHLYDTNTVWSDSVANAVISGVGYAYKVYGDIVTLADNATGFSQTKFWDGDSWEIISQVYDGALVVNGTLFGDALVANTVTASRINVTSMENMIRDPNITDTAYWSLTGGAILSGDSNISTNLYAPSGVYVAGTGQASGAISEISLQPDFFARVEAGRPYRFKAEARRTSGYTGQSYLYATFYLADKVTSISTIAIATDDNYRAVALSSAGNWLVNEIYTVPINAAWVKFRMYTVWSSSLTNAGGIYWANPSLSRATNAELIVDGSISADKLSANFGTFENYIRVGATGSTTDAFYIAGNNYSSAYRMWAGSLTPTAAPFSITKAGGIRATDLNIFSPTGELILSSLGLTDYGRNLFLLGTGTFVNPIVKILTSNTDKVDVQLVSDVTVRFKLSIPNQVITEEFGAGYGPPGGTQYDYPPYTGSDPFPTQIVANIQRSIEGGAWSTIETITLNKNTHYEVQEGVVEEPYGWDYESSSSRWRFFAGIHEWRLVGKSPYLLNGGIHYAGSGSELEQFLDFTLTTADEFSFRVAVSQTGGTHTMSSAARTLTMTDIDPGRGFITGEGGISGGDVVNADTLGGNPPSYFLTSGAVSGGTLVGSFTSLVTPSLVSRVAIVNSVNGTLSAASHANRQLYLNGNITAPNTGFVKGDYMAITADGSNRTLTRGASSTMYVNGVNTASVTIPAYCSIGLKYTASNVYEVLGIGVSGGFDASDITSGVFATARLGSGTADSTKYLRGDGTWQTYSTGGTPAWADVTGKPASLVSIAGLTTAANKMIYSTASDTYAVTDLSAFARTILDDADGAAVRTTIGAAATSHSHAASDVTSGTFDAARIPSLAASIVTSGTFDAARIPSLAASIITSGVLDAARLGSGTADSTKYLRGDGTWQTYGGGGGGPFDTSDITTGVFDMARLGTGTADDTKYLRGDGTWQVYSTGGAPSWTAVTDKPDSLVSIAGLTTAADKMIYSTALDTYAVTDLSSFARTILDDADGSAVRTTIGAAAASHNHAASDITSGVLATARLGSGTADSTKYLRGDGTWQDYGGGGGSFDDTDDYTLSGTWQFNNYVSINTPQRYGFAFELKAVSHDVSQTRNGYALRGNATDDGTGWLGGLFMESTGSGVPSVSIYGPLDSTAGANTTQKAVEVYGSGGTQRIRLHAYGQQSAEFGDSGLELSGISTETRILKIGAGRSGTGASHLRLIGDTTYSSWGTTLYRDDNSDANSNSWLRHRGTGLFVIQTNEAAGILFQTSATSRMTINSSGEVDFGTSTVQSSGLIRTRRNGDNIEWGHTNTGGYGATLGCASGSGYPYISFNCMAGATGNTFKTVGRTGNVIYGNATGGIVFQYVSNSSADNQSASTLSTLNTSGVWSAADFSATSDRRIKDNIIDFDNALEKIRKLKPRYFNFKGDDQRKIGFVAQEIEKILPEVVTTSDEPVNGIRNLKSVSHGNVVAVVVGATKELDSEVTTLKKRIDKLEKMVARLLRRAA